MIDFHYSSIDNLYGRDYQNKFCYFHSLHCGFDSFRLAIIASSGIFTMLMENLFYQVHTPLTFFRKRDCRFGPVCCAPFIVGLFGLFLEATIIRRFYNAAIVAMLATYAIGLIVREVVRPLIGGRFWKVTEPIPGLFEIGDRVFPFGEVL